MDRFESLEKKVHQAVEQIAILRRERDQIKAESKLLEEENKRIQKLLNESEDWNEKKKVIIARMEKVLKKINALKN